MTRKVSAIGGGAGSGGDPPGLDMAMTVMAVAAVIGGSEQFGLWPAALDGAAGTIVPAAVVVVLAGWRMAGRAGRGLAAVWARRGWGWRPPEAIGEAGQGVDRVDAPMVDIEANAAILAVHLPDPTLFPPPAANDDEKDEPSAM